MRILPFLLAQAVALTWTPSPTPNATTSVYRITGTCPATINGGTLIASSLSGGAYTDATVAAGTSYCYYATATAGNSTSGPSNAYAAAVPTIQIPTTVTLTTSTVNTYLTKVTAKVTAATGTTVPQGTIVFVFNGPAGSVTFTTALNKQGTVTDIVATEALRLVPLTATYAGNSGFASSTATLQ